VAVGRGHGEERLRRRHDAADCVYGKLLHHAVNGSRQGL
jgi:hypothetical protein